METNHQLASAMVFGATIVLTIWFAKGYLNTFIKNSFAIVAMAIGAIFKLLDICIFSPLGKIKIPKIRIPYGVKILWNFFVGIGILVLDHFYSTTLYEADETTFYHFVFQGTTYWITKEALIIGGFFILIGSLRLLNIVLKGIDYLLNRKIQLVIEARR